jgi:hypothetical protein
MRHPLSKSMMFVALAYLWFPAAAYCWNAFSPWPWRSAHLNGAPVTLAVSERSLETFIDRSLQDSLAKVIGPSIPFFNDAIRVHNQIVYSGFGLSPSHHILIGKDEYLHNPLYTNVYCRRDIAGSADDLRQWAQEKRDIQDIITARGQIFLYVLTPSKVEFIPDTLPESFPCLSQDRRQFTAVALSYLDAMGVKYVDATATMEEVEPRFGYEPFPRYGIHWTELAAYPATLQIIAAINSARGGSGVIPYEIVVSPANTPVIQDYDYGLLMNILWPLKANNTATFSVTTPAPSPCPVSPSILAVGGSFFQALGTNLSRGPCAPIMNHLFYFSLDTYHYESGELTGTGKPDYELLKSAEIVIVEENIGILPAKNISQFLKHLQAEATSQ